MKVRRPMMVYNEGLPQAHSLHAGKDMTDTENNSDLEKVFVPVKSSLCPLPTGKGLR